MNFKSLKEFVQQVEEKYGQAALEMRVEVHSREEFRDEVLWMPHDLDHLGVATYPADKENGLARETVVVIR